MGTEISLPNGNEASAPSVEIEFALVLSRMIQSVSDDPKQMRNVVYELARRKLQEQYTNEGTNDIAALDKALELAIRGVEDFSIKNPLEVASRRSLTQTMSSSIAERPRLEEIHSMRAKNVSIDTPTLSPGKPRAFHEGGLRFSAPWRYFTVLAIVAVGALIAGRTAILDWAQRKNTVLPAMASKQSTTATIQERFEAVPQPQKPSRLLPTSYGIYAESEGNLYELEVLPGRAPDLRVAISPVIATPSRVNLPNGRIKFVVFRRDSGSAAADRAEVRVIARIKQAVSFDAAGKQVVAKGDDAWVIRNISQPYRVGPIIEQPDMYEVQGENADTGLTPGRYALILKGQAYDFSVSGPITDTRQCLERLTASNGLFYSECPKP